MQKINTADGLFVDGNPSTGALGTILTAAWLNMLQAEVISVLAAAGIAVDGAKSDQLATAIQTLLRGKATVNVAGGVSVNLAAAQYGMPILILTGALTANINLIFPAISGAWIVRNQTTGNFTVTCKTQAGTGVVVSQGCSNALWGDGTNIYAEQTDWANIVSQAATAFTSGGAAPSFTLTPSPALQGYAVPQRFRVKFHAAGAGADTLNVSGLGAKSIKQYDSAGNKVAAVIVANQLADVEYDGVDFVILDPLPVATASIPAARKNLKASPVAMIGLTGSTTNGGNQITGASTTAGLIANGTYITGQGIPAGTYITGIAGTTLTLSQAVTVTGAATSMQAYPLNNRTTTADALTVTDGASYKTLLNVSVTGNIGTVGANGLDTGVLAASTWYYEFVIYNPTTATTAKLYSLSLSAPTLPAGYTMFARTGSVRTDANKILMYTLQIDRRSQYVVALGTNVAALPMMASGAAGSISAPVAYVSIAVGAFVSPAACRIQVSGGSATGNQPVICGPNAAYGATGSQNSPPLDNNVLGGAVTVARMTVEFALESSNIYWASYGSGGYINCLGWEENL